MSLRSRARPDPTTRWATPCARPHPARVRAGRPSGHRPRLEPPLAVREPGQPQRPGPAGRLQAAARDRRRPCSPGPPRVSAHGPGSPGTTCGSPPTPRARSGRRATTPTSTPEATVCPRGRRPTARWSTPRSWPGTRSGSPTRPAPRTGRSCRSSTAASTSCRSGSSTATRHSTCRHRPVTATDRAPGAATGWRVPSGYHDRHGRPRDPALRRIRRRGLGHPQPPGSAQRVRPGDATRAARAVVDAAHQRRRPLHRPDRRGRQGVLHRSGPGGYRLVRRPAAGQAPRVQHTVGLRRSGPERLPQDEPAVEAGDRRRQRDGLRRRLLHPRRGRLHHRRRPRHLLRPPRHLRHARRLRAHFLAPQDALPGNHAPVVTRGPRADVGRTGAPGGARLRGGAGGGARRAGRWAAAAIADQPALAIQGTLRALWMGLEVSRRQALDHAFLFTNVGTDPASLAEGQERFTSGKRIEWRLR